jgi:hypothetical protein
MKLFFAVSIVLLLGAAWFGPNAHSNEAVESSPTKEASNRVPLDAFSLYQKEIALNTHSSKDEIEPTTPLYSQIVPGFTLTGESLKTADGACNLTSIVNQRVFIQSQVPKNEQGVALGNIFTEDAVLTMYKNQTNEQTSFHGRDEITLFFQRHYLTYFTATTSVLTHLSSDVKGNVVFMTAKCNELGMDTVADTLIIDHETCLIRAQTTMMINSDATEKFGGPLREWGPLSNIFGALGSTSVGQR